jgi:hypothetical protein
MACDCNGPPKEEKTQNKMIYFACPPTVCLPKRLKNGPFLLSVRFITRQKQDDTDLN